MARDLGEKTLDSQVVYQGVFLKVRKDVAGLPDGSTGVREYIVHPGAAAMVPLFDDGRILIERQFRYAVRQTFVEIPAGKLDPGETSLQTAKRELVEETGHVAAEWAFLTKIHPAIGFADEFIDIYLCRGLSKAVQQLDLGEFVELDVVTLGWLVDEVRAGRLTDVKTQIAVHRLERIVSGEWDWPTFEPA
jgi:ADP-ribose pyrophosphatase